MAIAIPPAPEWAPTLTYGLAAAGMIIGLAILLWGRIVGRGLLMALGACAGFFLAQPIVQQFPNYPMAIKFAATSVAAIGALLAGRIIWGTACGVVFAIVACIIAVPVAADALWRDIQSPIGAIMAGSWPGSEQIDQLKGSVETFRDSVSAGMWAAILAALAIPVALGAFRPRLITIFGTGLFGAVGITAGLVLAATATKPAAWDVAWNRTYIPAGLFGLLLVVGVAYQYRSAFAADKKAKERAEQAKKEEEARKEKAKAK